MTGKLHGSLGEQKVPDAEGWVPLYYEGGAIIGKAKVRGNSVEIELDPGTPIIDLMKENLVGFSTVSLRAKPGIFTEEITMKEKTDD